MTISGSRVVTPRGNVVTAHYDRHHIDYEIPDGEPNKGDQLTADQLNDEQIRVFRVGKANSETSPVEIWTPCKPIS